KKTHKVENIAFFATKGAQTTFITAFVVNELDIDPETELNTPPTVAKQALYDSLQHVGFRKTSKKTHKVENIAFFATKGAQTTFIPAFVVKARGYRPQDRTQHTF